MTPKHSDCITSIFRNNLLAVNDYFIICNLGSDKAAAAEPANGCSLPIAPTKDGNHVSHDSSCTVVFLFFYIWDQFNMS